jgi:hypothetical protein
MTKNMFDNAFSLIIPGTYTKFTVNNRGLITDTH